MRDFVAGAFIGFFYSLLPVVSGARFVHFLPRVSVLQSLAYAALFGLFVVVASFLLRSRARVWLGVGVLCLLHFLYWLIAFSFWSTSLVSEGLLIALAGGLFLSGFLVGIRYVVRWLDNLATSVGLAVLIVLLVLKGTFVYFLPVGNVSDVVKYPGDTEVNATLYPFSVRVNQWVTGPDWLVGTVRSGKQSVVLVLDAFREDFLGRKVSGIPVTPNLSNMAESNLSFSNYRVQGPNTKTSVASFFTGRYVREHGVYAFGTKDTFGTQVEESPGETGDYYGHVLPDQYRTLAERLRETGTSSFGATSMTHISDPYNFDQGFDLFFTPWDQPEANADLTILNYALFWLLRTDPSDTFLYLHLKGPHFPYSNGRKNTRFWQETKYFHDGEIQPPRWTLPPLDQLIQSRLDSGKLRSTRPQQNFLRHLYAAELNYYDLYFMPRFVESLKGVGLYRDSLIAVTSDHGESLFDHKGYYGHGEFLYDEIVKVPLVLKPPEESNFAETLRVEEESTLESIDFSATLLDFMGADRRNHSGQSFLQPTNRNDTGVFHEVAFSEKASDGTIDQVSVVANARKLLLDYAGPSYELYNLARDPGEKSPITKGEAVIDDLTTRLIRHLGEGNTIRNQSVKLKRSRSGTLRQIRNLGYF